MDKERNQNERHIISPTLLTPCRPIGLRRKRSVAKSTNSPFLKSSTTADVTSPSTPLNRGSCQSPLSTAPIISAENIQEQCQESIVTSDLKNVRKEEQKSTKRKSTIPSGNSTFKRKIIPTNDLDSPCMHNNNNTKKEIPLNSDEKSLPVKNEDKKLDMILATSLCGNEKKSNTDIDIPHSHSANVSSCLNIEESLKNRVVSSTEINALRERIASKEKKLKELELTALYKKKHDQKQVAKEINSWLQGSKEALCDLQSELATRGQSYTLTELLKTLGIPPELIGIDESD